MVRTREEAAKRAEASRTNEYGMCQQWARELYGADSAGDRDHDGDADAVDGWLSEPKSARHTDRNPPRGVPVAYGNKHGHRAMSLGGGKIRSTDAGGHGKVATVDLDWPEKTWGLKYLGWSDTIDGQAIPLDVQTEPDVAFVVDVNHGKWTEGLRPAMLEQQGYAALIAKCTQGSTYADPHYADFRAGSETAGLPFAAYHFLEAGQGDKQAANLAAHIVDRTIPVMIDCERNPLTGGKPTYADVSAFTAGCRDRGLTISLLYLSRTYWSSIGAPSLARFKVVNAAYHSKARGYGAALYPGDDDAQWDAYGGTTPLLWQFADTAKIDGYPGATDVSAFRGRPTKLLARGLFKTWTTTPEKDWFDMASLDDLRKVVREELDALVVDIPATEQAAFGKGKRSISDALTRTWRLAKDAASPKAPAQ